MSVKVDGTNGLLQNYDYQVPLTGFSYTFSSYNVLVMNPAGTLATGTITMPASPVDGMTVSFSSTKAITALTVNANTGQTINGAPTSLVANGSASFIYRLSSTAWFPVASANVLGGVTSLNGVTGAVSTVALYDIGSFIAGRPANITAYAVNSTIAGSSLYATGTAMGWYNGGPFFAQPGSGTQGDAGSYVLVNTGSWRCVSPAGTTNGGGFGQSGIWVRYA